MSEVENKTEEITKEEVWNVVEFAQALYKGFAGISDYLVYNTEQKNQLLAETDNNPKIPKSLEEIKYAIANYVKNPEQLQGFSEFMAMWDGIYKQAIDYKLNLLSFDISKYCINVKNSSEYKSQEYLDDCKRVSKFLQNFGAKQAFRNATKQMLLRDTYFCWLRDSYGSFDDDIIELNDDNISEKKTSSYALQTMPQKYCKITGEFTAKNLRGKGFLWDFDLNYFYNSNVNILDYDPSLAKSFKEFRDNEKLKSFIIDNNKELNSQNSYYGNNYVRTKVNNGAWVFKFSNETFLQEPPLAYLLKSVFNDDLIEELQKDKDIISANAIITGEMKTRDKDNVGNNKSAFTIDPKQVGVLMKLARSGIDRNIKQIALPLEDIKMYQFSDSNNNMVSNKFATNAGLAGHNSHIIYSSDSLTQEQARIASTVDYHSIADAVYPQFENFLNFFVNKKTKKYKFRFKVSGSTLLFLRQDELDQHTKMMDKGIQIPLGRIGSLLGYEADEFEYLVNEAKFGDMQDKLFLLMNSNTAKDQFGGVSSGDGEKGRPQSNFEDLTDSGAKDRGYQ